MLLAVLPRVLSVLAAVLPRVLSVLAAVLPRALSVLLAILPRVLSVLLAVLPRVLSVLLAILPRFLTVPAAVLPPFLPLVATFLHPLDELRVRLAEATDSPIASLLAELVGVDHAVTVLVDFPSRFAAIVAESLGPALLDESLERRAALVRIDGAVPVLVRILEQPRRDAGVELLEPPPHADPTGALELVLAHDPVPIEIEPFPPPLGDLRVVLDEPLATLLV